jgi:hypothetical protein
MSVAWSIARAKELAERRKKQNKCDRCSLFYFKTHEKCPHCSELPDYKVKLLLKKRKNERLSIGRYMFYGMFVIVITLYIMNT